MDDAIDALNLSVDERAVLLGSELGAGLDARGLAKAMASTWVRLVAAAKGEILAMPGDSQTGFYLLLSGRLEVVRSRADGTRQVLDILRAGDPCGTVTAMAGKPRWPAEVHVRADARLLWLETAGLAQVGDDAVRARLMANVSGIVAARAAHLSFRADLLSRRGLRERLATFMLHEADDSGRVDLRLTRQELADFLVVSRASMTRELGRMADDGLIRLVGRGFQILDAPGLTDAAG